MTSYRFNPPPVPSVAVRCKDQRFSIRRLFFVGRNDHHEMELVLAIDAPGFWVAAEQAHELVYGCACGHLTTRPAWRWGHGGRRAEWNSPHCRPPP